MDNCDIAKKSFKFNGKLLDMPTTFTSEFFKVNSLLPEMSLTLDAYVIHFISLYKNRRKINWKKRPREIDRNEKNIWPWDFSQI